MSEAQMKADSVSSDATFNLFNWYRNNEGGIWLDEGFEDAESVRRNNSHPWIKDDSDQDHIVESGDSESITNWDSWDNIKRWQDDITKEI